MFSRKSEKEKVISFGCLWNEVVFLGYNSFGEGMNSAAFEKKNTQPVMPKKICGWWWIREKVSNF